MPPDRALKRIASPWKVSGVLTYASLNFSKVSKFSGPMPPPSRLILPEGEVPEGEIPHRSRSRGRPLAQLRQLPVQGSSLCRGGRQPRLQKEVLRVLVHVWCHSSGEGGESKFMEGSPTTHLESAGTKSSSQLDGVCKTLPVQNCRVARLRL